MPTRAETIERASLLQRELDQLNAERENLDSQLQHLDVGISERQIEIEDLLRASPSDGDKKAPAAKPQPEASDPPEEAEAAEPDPTASIPLPTQGPIDPENWETWPMSDLGLSQPVTDAFAANGVLTLGHLSKLFEQRSDLTGVGIGVADAAMVLQRYKDWARLFGESQGRVQMEVLAGA